MKSALPDIEALDLQEKLLLLEILWLSLSANPDNIPFADWQVEELDRRKAEYTQHPSSGLSWQEVKARILENKR